jgi:hypothetical protein
VSAAKVAFAEQWYRRGECPGCGARLEKVAGRGTCHYGNGSCVSNLSAGESGTCSWSADDLLSLVLIGSGQVLDGTAVYSASYAQADPPPAVPSIHAEGSAS